MYCRENRRCGETECTGVKIDRSNPVEHVAVAPLSPATKPFSSHRSSV